MRDHIIESENGHTDLIQDEDGNLCQIRLKNMDPNLPDEEEMDLSNNKTDKPSFQQSENPEETFDSDDTEERQRKRREKIIDARLLVTSGRVDVDFNMCLTIHETGRVYNGRLIIKSNY